MPKTAFLLPYRRLILCVVHPAIFASIVSLCEFMTLLVDYNPQLSAAVV
jgi:hypothetical protein